MLTKTDLSIIAIIGIILLIGIVKKNAIMMIDFALAAERNEGKNSRDAIFEACLLRFRPILMTTMAAMLGALPLALGHGDRLGTAPAAGHHHHRRTDRQPDADALHHAGGLPLLRPLSIPGGSECAHAGVGGRLSRWRKAHESSVIRPDGSVRCPGWAHWLQRGAELPSARRSRAGRIQGNSARYLQGSGGARPMPADPSDAFHKGKWWEIYNDPALNALEEQVAVNNQNVAQLAALYQEAKALVRVSRSALYPTIGATSSVTASRAGGSGAVTGGVVGGSGIRQLYSLPLDISWEPDLWGSIHRGITAASASAQASEADIENAKLLYQSELAQDYFNLHGSDSDVELLQRTAASYQEYLTLTQSRFKFGIATDLDVAQAQAQIYSTESTMIDLGVQRAQYEHAIAVLTGQPPAAVSIAPQTLTAPPPPVPIALPSKLLERRPDIAGAERRVAAANEQIGIAMAAFYPTLSLERFGRLPEQQLHQVVWDAEPLLLRWALTGADAV